MEKEKIKTTEEDSMSLENFDDGVTHVAKSFKAEMTNTQKLETLKEIEEMINVIRDISFKLSGSRRLLAGIDNELAETAEGIIHNQQSFLNTKVCKVLKQEANKIGELIGCGVEIKAHKGTHCYCGICGLCPICGDWIPNNNEPPLFREQLFCLTCKKANEILARINNG